MNLMATTRECPHCAGYTTCSCKSCLPSAAYKGRGICKVCSGTGVVPYMGRTLEEERAAQQLEERARKDNAAYKMAIGVFIGIAVFISIAVGVIYWGIRSLH